MWEGYIGPSVQQRNVALESSDEYDLRHAIEPGSTYVVTVRAANSLGWSTWSSPSCTAADCETACIAKSIPDPPFPWPQLMGGLVGTVLLLALCAFCIWKSNLGRILAPKMRRRTSEARVDDFVSSDITPMEEQDPELVVNPIFVHKMKRERERQRKGKLKKGAGGMGRTGGLARLGIQLESRAQVVDEKFKDMYAVDHYLERERGIVDESKNKTAYEREMAGKALLKGQKKACLLYTSPSPRDS